MTRFQSELLARIKMNVTGMLSLTLLRSARRGLQTGHSSGEIPLSHKDPVYWTFSPGSMRWTL